MDGPRNIILNKISQRKTNTNDIPYRWSLKYDTNEFVYETDSQTQTTDLWLPRGKGCRRGLDWEFVTIRCKLYIKDG